MFSKMKLLSAMDSLVKDGMEAADSILKCTEKGEQPGKEQIGKVYALMYKVEGLLGHDINLAKYPSLRANYKNWKKENKKR